MASKCLVRVCSASLQSLKPGARQQALPLTIMAKRNSSTDSKKYVQLSIDENTGVATLLLNRAPINMVHLDMAKQVQQALVDLESNESVQALVLGSEIPKTFCGGFEFKEVYKPKKERLLEFWRTFQDVMLRLYSSRLASIAAVQGHAIAGGCGLAIACDLRIMADYEKARFGFNETHIGIIPPVWLNDMVKNILGHRKTELTMMTGPLYSPSEALRFGFVDRVVPHDELLGVAQKEAAKWAKIPGFARSQTKMDLKRKIIDNMTNRREEYTTVFVNHLMKDSVQDVFTSYLQSVKK